MTTLLRNVLILAGLMILLQGTQPVFALSAWENYIPPEIAYASDLKQKVTLPGRIDVNHAGLGELQLLPGFDEDLALKVIRLRPLASVQEFYSLPGVNKKEIDRFIKQLEPKVLFK